MLIPPTQIIVDGRLMHLTIALPINLHSPAGDTQPIKKAIGTTAKPMKKIERHPLVSSNGAANMAARNHPSG